MHWGVNVKVPQVCEIESRIFAQRTLIACELTLGFCVAFNDFRVVYLLKFYNFK